MTPWRKAAPGSSPPSSPASTPASRASPAPRVSTAAIPGATTRIIWFRAMARAPRDPSLTTTTSGPSSAAWRPSDSASEGPILAADKQATQTRGSRGSQYDAGRSEKSKATGATAAKSFTLCSSMLQSPVRIGLVATGLGAADPLGHLEGVALDPVHAPTSAARGVGYLTALRAAGLPVRPAWIRSPTYTRQGARDAACSLLDQEEPPSAIFSVDNLLTLGAFEAIQGSGLRFPRDISLLGFDDLEWTTIVRPRLSVVAQPAYDLGAAAARRLLDRLNGDRSTPQLLLLETSLVERDSIRPPGSPGTSRPSIPLIRPSTARGRC
jgi:hypothetical protein